MRPPLVRNRDHDAHAIPVVLERTQRASFYIIFNLYPTLLMRLFRPTVRHPHRHISGVRQGLAALLAVHVHHSAYATRIGLQGGVIEALLLRRLVPVQRHALQRPVDDVKGCGGTRSTGCATHASTCMHHVVTRSHTFVRGNSLEALSIIFSCIERYENGKG